jgi:signal transduction histidine kinase
MTPGAIQDEPERRRATDAPAAESVCVAEQLRQAQASLARLESEHAQLKAEFLQAQKMEAVGRLASGVAHDFKNVLTLIAGYADLLFQQADTPGAREPLAEIRSACRRAIGLAEQLLSYSRREAAQQSPISLNTILADAGRMLHRMLPAHVDLAIRDDPELGLVMANAGQMHQVLLNLVVNARDAMPSGGRLAVEVRNVDVEPGSPDAKAGAPPGPHVLMSVADNGVGMTDETRARALEPFFTTKEGRTGTGLGLSTVHAIITDCHGRLVIDSAPGVGTTVRIYLPRLEALPGDGAGARAPGPAAARLSRVLVVDADESVRRLLSDLFTSAGFEVSAVAGVGAAAALQPHDVAVVDLGTLEEDGAAPPLLPGVPPSRIVGMSGASRQPAAIAARVKIGVTVAKPVAPRQLLRAVRDMLEAD